MTIITRFAPSPTGNLHIGGARTALFNALYAQAKGGKYFLRIEDTDKARSTNESVDALLDGLGWLGLLGDGTPIFQSQNAARHVEVAHEMLARGSAFKCYVSLEELAARREQGEVERVKAKDEKLSESEQTKAREKADGLLAAFRSPYRDGTDTRNNIQDSEKPFTIRLRAPDSRPVVLNDAVQGKITIQAEELDDLILLRADGTPTYMLAVVVDDHDMGVTHVIRGDDHLRNAFRQVPIYHAMGWDVPVFAHVPLIHGTDGKKLSKRHGATSTIEYKDLGYVPEGLKAYLLRLGWSHGDQEIFTWDEAAAVFDLAGLGKSPARLDYDKLNHINAQFMQSRNPNALFDNLLPFLEVETPLTPQRSNRIKTALPHLVGRADTLVALAEACTFLRLSPPLDYNKRARKALKGEKLEALAKLSEFLEKWTDWSEGGTQTALDSYLAKTGAQIGQVGPPLRAALTGGLAAPDLHLILCWLGRNDTLELIEAALQDNIAQ